MDGFRGKLETATSKRLPVKIATREWWRIASTGGLTSNFPSAEPITISAFASARAIDGMGSMRYLFFLVLPAFLAAQPPLAVVEKIAGKVGFYDSSGKL